MIHRPLYDKTNQMTDNMFLKGSKNKPRVVSEHSGINQCLEIIKIKPCSTEHKISMLTIFMYNETLVSCIYPAN